MDEALLRQAELARDELSRLELEVGLRRLEFQQAVRRIHSAGLSMRDIASAMGLSHQRVQQIVSGGMDVRRRTRRSTLLDRLVHRSPQDCDPSRPPDRLYELLGNRYSVDAREAMSLAQQEARALNHGYLGTEHLLLGLLRAEDGLAARLLRAIGIDLDRSRAMVETLLGIAPTPPDDRLSPTGRVKQVLELADVEAKRMRSTHVRSEHLLLGLAREGRGLGARVLTEFGIGYEQIRARISRAAVACSFCGRSGLDVAHLVAGPAVFICDHCIDAADKRPSSGQAVQHSANWVTAVLEADHTAACSFCGKRVAAVDRLISAGPQASICSECLVLCRQIEQEERESYRPGRS